MQYVRTCQINWTFTEIYSLMWENEGKWNIWYKISVRKSIDNTCDISYCDTKLIFIFDFILI